MSDTIILLGGGIGAITHKEDITSVNHWSPHAFLKILSIVPSHILGVFAWFSRQHCRLPDPLTSDQGQV